MHRYSNGRYCTNLTVQNSVSSVLHVWKENHYKPRFVKVGFNAVAKRFGQCQPVQNEQAGTSRILSQFLNGVHVKGPHYVMTQTDFIDP